MTTTNAGMNDTVTLLGSGDAAGNEEGATNRALALTALAGSAQKALSEAGGES